MTKKLSIALTTIVLALGATGVALGQSCLDIHNSANGCAPSPLDGDTVNLTGTVYAVAGTYNSGSTYFQCASGGGLLFFASGNSLLEGDIIDVTGTVGAFGDEIQLNGASWNVVGSQPAAPTPILSGDLNNGGNFLGDFMRVEGVLAKVSDGFNSLYTVDDGSGPAVVFVDGSTGIDTSIYDGFLGDYVSVIGATKCFGGIGEILPRRDDDLQLVSVPTVNQSWGAVKSSF